MVLRRILTILFSRWRRALLPSRHPAMTSATPSPTSDLRDPPLRKLTGAAAWMLDAKPGGAEGSGGAAAGVTRPCNLFSRALQISLGAAKVLPLSPRAIKPLSVTVGDHGGGMQMSSSPRASGIKRS